MKLLLPAALALLLLAGCSAPTVEHQSTPKPAAIETVPNVVGLDEAGALSTLARAGLVGSFDKTTDFARVVIDQKPKPGEQVAYQSTVQITLSEPKPAPTPTPTADPVVTYTVTGNGSQASSITYSTGGAGQAQATNARLPWTFTMPQSGSLGYVLLAQDGNGTSITCSISVGGDVVATNTSTGPMRSPSARAAR